VVPAGPGHVPAPGVGAQQRDHDRRARTTRGGGQHRRHCLRAFAHRRPSASARPSLTWPSPSAHTRRSRRGTPSCAIERYLRDPTLSSLRARACSCSKVQGSCCRR
jgi:hypothetical protein